MTDGTLDRAAIDAVRPFVTNLRVARSTTSWNRVLVHLVGIGLAAATAFGPFGVPGDVVASLIAAWLFLHADAMQHEAVHGHISRTALGNRLVGLLASVPLLVPYSLYAAFHLAHHAHAATEDDPEGRHDLPDHWPWLVASWRSGRFLATQWDVALGTLGGTFPSYVRSDRQRAAVRVDTVLTLLGGILLVGGSALSPTFRWIWLGPFTAYVLVLFPLFHIYEHLDAEARSEAAAQPLDPANLSATFRIPGPVSIALWHSTLHTAHHAFPSVPGRDLPELQALLDQELPADLVRTGFIRYLRFPSERGAPSSGATGSQRALGSRRLGPNAIDGRNGP